MKLKGILPAHFNDSAPGRRYALLALPGDELPEMVLAANRFILEPSTMQKQALDEAVDDVAQIASHFFDEGMEEGARIAKSEKRQKLFQASVDADDQTMLLFADGNEILGYARVLPVGNQQFGSYLDKYDPPESGFDVCDSELLKSGEASIFMQALVFPKSDDFNGEEKHYLQQAALMRLLANFLNTENVRAGVTVYFTAFHPYTNQLAEEWGAEEISKNPDGHEIYKFEISPSAPINTLGRELADRLLAGHKPLTLTPQRDVSPD